MTMAVADAAEAVGPRRPWYLLFLLILVLFVCYLDRYILAILVQPIKNDLGLSDSQIGLLTGLGFSAFFAMFALPLANQADKRSRLAVICLCLVAWSAMTALSGMARNFWMMLLARFGVGAGEAGAGPASYSIVADLFPLSRRATAMSLLALGGATGMMGGLAIGGWLESEIGWRGAFVAAAVPGFVLALVIWLTAKDPPRTGSRASAAEPDDLTGFRTLWRHRPYRALIAAYCTSVLLSSGQMQWLPAFFERSFGADRAELGARLAATQGVGMMVGMLAGGLLSDALSRRDPLWAGRVTIFGTTGFVVPNIAMLLAETASQAFTLAIFTGFFAVLATGPSFALMQSMVPATLRARATAWSNILTMLIGAGGGPMIVGFASDALTARFGAEALRYALLGTTTIAGIATILFFVRMQHHLKVCLRDGKLELA